MKNKSNILKLAENNKSFYLYDESKIIDNAQKLKSCFKDVQLLYSVKTNPNRYILNTVAECGFGFDAASYAEVQLGAQIGLDCKRIYYSAPGKTEYDIEKAFDKAVIVADSLNELEIINRIAAKKGVTADIGVRINPDFTFDGKGGLSGKFGIDEEMLYANRKYIELLENINIVGIHVHSKSQELDYNIIKKYYNNMFQLCEKVQHKLGIALDFVNLGSGLGVPYSAEDMPLDINSLGAETALLIKKLKEKLNGIKVIIETGRYIVCDAGVYATTVLDKKQSCGKTYVILQNTLNGFIRPSVAALVESYAYETPKASEPLYTKPNAVRISVLNNTKETETVTLCGNLCTAADVVVKDITLAAMNVGDVVVMSNAGSYAAVLTPFQFSSQLPPKQFFLTKNGEIAE